MIKTDARLLVQVEESYGTRYIRARVLRFDVDDNDYVQLRPFPGFGNEDVASLAGFVVTGYLGHAMMSGGDSDPGEIWGWDHYFAPDRVELPEHARNMASVLVKVRKGLDKLESEIGRPTEYAAYVARIASVLKLPIYVRNTARAFDMTGDAYSVADASKLAYWMTEVSTLAERGEFKRIREAWNSTSRV